MGELLVSLNQKIAQAAKEDAARWNVSWATKEVEHHIRTFEAGAAKYAELLSDGVETTVFKLGSEYDGLKINHVSGPDIDYGFDKPDLEVCPLSALHASQLEVEKMRDGMKKISQIIAIHHKEINFENPSAYTAILNEINKLSSKADNES